MADNAAFIYSDDMEILEEMRTMRSTYADKSNYPRIGVDPLFLHTQFDLKFSKLEKIGDIHVSVEGKRLKNSTVIVTLHDVGQNHKTCFESFFKFQPFKSVAERFTVYHLNFPGQHEKASELQSDYSYPTMDRMADLVKDVLSHYDTKSAICIGVGAGANVFLRLAQKYPSLVESLILFAGSARASTMSEQAHAMIASHCLKARGVNRYCKNYFLWKCFGCVEHERNSALATKVTSHLFRIKYPRNLAMFLESYNSRTSINLKKTSTDSGSLKCGMLLMVGALSPALEDTIVLNSKLDPASSTWMKISDATNMVLHEKPNAVANAIINFLQGYGYAVKARAPSV